MSTRIFELSISVPCKDNVAAEAVTGLVEHLAKQLYTNAVLLSWRGMPRITLKYTSLKGEIEMNIVGEQPREQSNDRLEDLTR